MSVNLSTCTHYVQTPKAVYLIIQAVNNQQLSISTERAIPLGSIKYVSTSIYRDDWFAIGVGAPQEPDPLINCVLKTEFFTHLSKALRGGLNLKIGPMLVATLHETLIRLTRDPGLNMTRSPESRRRSRWSRNLMPVERTSTRAAPSIPDLASQPTRCRGRLLAAKKVSANRSTSASFCDGVGQAGVRRTGRTLERVDKQQPHHRCRCRKQQPRDQVPSRDRHRNLQPSPAFPRPAESSLNRFKRHRVHRRRRTRRRRSSRWLQPPSLTRERGPRHRLALHRPLHRPNRPLRANRDIEFCTTFKARPRMNSILKRTSW